jgi:hypothetical protein
MKNQTAKIMLVAALCAPLAACGLPDAVTPGITALKAIQKNGEPTPRPSAPPPPPRVQVRPSGELDDGTAQHVQTAAGAKVVLSYWTDDDPKAWTPTSQGILQSSVQVQGVDAKKVVRVTRYAVLATASSPFAKLVDDRGQFVVSAPYTYGSTFALPAVAQTVKAEKLRIVIDIEVETAPGTGRFTRQTLIDQLGVPYIVPGVVVSAAKG